MQVNTDFILESEMGLQTIRVSFSVDATKWENMKPVEKLGPAVTKLRTHRPFPTYQIINVSQTVTDAG